MGDSIKSLATVAIGFIANIVLPGAGTFLGAALRGLVTMVAGKVIGAGDDMDSAQDVGSYATSNLTNDTNNNAIVPIIYGKARVGGNRVFADLEDNGTDNDHVFEIIVFAGHEINAFIEMFADNVTMFQGATQTNCFRVDTNKVFVNVYTVKPTGNIQAITSYNSGTDTYTLTDLNSITMQNTQFLDASLPSGTAFAVVHHIYDATDNNNRKNITAVLEGKKIRTITDAETISTTTSYSNNPAEIALDFLTDSLNFNESDSKIDIAEFYTSKVFNNNNFYECNIAFTAKTNLSSAFQEVLATFRGQIVYSQGIWKLKQDRPARVSTFNIRHEDIISGTFNWSQKKSKDIANKVILYYIDPDDEWQTKEVSVQDDKLIASDGREYIKELTLRGVTNEAQATKIAQLILNQFRYSEDENGDRIKVSPLVVSFTTTIKNPELEVGDLGKIYYYELPNEKDFVIVSVKTKMSGELEITALETADTHYYDDNELPIIQ